MRAGGGGSRRRMAPCNPMVSPEDTTAPAEEMGVPAELAALDVFGVLP